MVSEVKKLLKENERIREKIDNLIGIDSPIYSPFWDKIEELIKNEIEIEGYCHR